MSLDRMRLVQNWSLFLVLLLVPLAWADKHGSNQAPKHPAASKPAKAARPAASSRSSSTHRPATTGSKPATTSGRTFGTGHSSSTATHTPANRATTSSRTTTTTTHTPGATTHTSTTTTHRPGATTRTTTTRTFSNGTTARVGAGGRVQSIHTANGTTITRTAGGQRTVVTSHNGRTVVGTGAGRGYVERPYFNRGGRAYYQRTYMFGGRRYAYAYGRYSYHGFFYYRFAPAFYFRPAFYGWAFNPWFAPVYYHWGWFGAPWYAPYGYYFAPAPYYPIASLWLTDYLLAQNLQAAYEARAANAAAGNVPPQTSQNPAVTPEIKQAIADEVKRQLDAERAAAAGQPVAPTAEQIPAALDPAARVFVVSSAIDVTAGGQACSLTAGDIITRIDDAPDANQNVSALVTSSKKSDCRSGQKVTVAVQDLQEMHNQFRQQIDSGLKTLADNQGKNGLPAAPDTRTSAGEVPAPAPDDVQTELQKQQADANQTETDVKQQVSAGN